MKHLRTLSREGHVPALAASTSTKQDQVNTLSEIITVLSSLVETLQSTSDAIKGTSTTS